MPVSIQIGNGPAWLADTEASALTIAGIPGGRFISFVGGTTVDVTSTGTVTLFSFTQTGLMVTKVVCRVSTFVVGAKATQASVDFGGNAGRNNWLTGVNPTINALNQYIIALPASAVARALHTSDWGINVATASDATTEVWTVDVFGFFI